MTGKTINAWLRRNDAAAQPQAGKFQRELASVITMSTVFLAIGRCRWSINTSMNNSDDGLVENMRFPLGFQAIGPEASSRRQASNS